MKNGSSYQIIREFFDVKDIQRMNKRLFFLRDCGMLTKDIQCPLSPFVYNDQVHAEMHEKYRYKLSEALSINLLPTYSYARIYSPREILTKHTDRPACEISLTSTLDFDTWDNQPWDIFAQEPNSSTPLKFRLYRGDILVYRGCVLEHWRNEFKGIYQSQIFMHFVDANGPNAEWIYDCRPSLGSSIALKDQEKVKRLTERKQNEFLRYNIIPEISMSDN